MAGPDILLDLSLVKGEVDYGPLFGSCFCYPLPYFFILLNFW